MRFLILTQYFPPEVGAAQNRLAAVAKELRRLGHEVEVVTAMPNHLLGRIYDGYRGKAYMREFYYGIPVHRTWVFAALGTGIPRLLNYLSFCFSSVLGLVRAKRPDIVFVESPPLFLAVPGWLAAWRAKAKLIFNVADLWPDAVSDFGVLREGAVLRMARGLERWAYRRASYVNAVTVGIAENLRTRKSVDAMKILYLPNGVDTVTLQPKPPDEALARSLGLAGKTVFIYAGTHGIAHGLQDVVDAAALVDPERIAVLFVGGGSSKAALMQHARRLRLRNVVFHDPVPLEKMSSFYSIAFAAICPVVGSAHAMMARPSKLFAAFACGVPVIYGAHGEGADLVEKAHAGVVIEPESARALADAMTELARDPEARERMGRAARLAAESDHSWRGIVESWVSGLDERCAG